MTYSFSTNSMLRSKPMRPQELNLLMVFDAIMTERSITRAADRLSMTQPAVSNAVSRMRVAWNDELFVKDGRNIQPTLHAQNLWDQVREPINMLTDAVNPHSFDPTTAKRTFRIAATDIMVDMAWRPLRKLIESEAPGINIHAIPYTIVNAEQVLDDAKVDLVCGLSNQVSTTIRSEYMFTPEYVCAMRNGHSLAKPKMSVKEFAEAEHLLMSLSGDISGVADDALARMGLTRRIAMTVNHFSSIIPLLQESNLIAVVPASTIENAVCKGELSVTKIPVEVAPSQLAMLWHKRQDRDGGLFWLREHIKAIVSTEVARQTKSVMDCLCTKKNKIIKN